MKYTYKIHNLKLYPSEKNLDINEGRIYAMLSGTFDQFGDQAEFSDTWTGDDQIDLNIYDGYMGEMKGYEHRGVVYDAEEDVSPYNIIAEFDLQIFDEDGREIPGLNEE